MKHKIRGKAWRVKERAGLYSDGLKCDGHADYEKRVICIEKHLSKRRRVDAVLHEHLHACLPDLSEAAVDEIATSAAKLLLKMGY